MGLQCGSGPLQVNGIPQHNGCCHQVEATGPVTLLLKTAVADFAQVTDARCKSEAFVCDKPAQATGVARKIRALRFSKIALEILFLIAYTFNEFR